MTDEIKETKAKKIRSDKELLTVSDTQELSSDELDRYLKLIDIQAKVQSVELVKRQTEQFRMKDSERRDKFTSRGRELRKTQRDQALQQSNCSHRKGGRGLEALIKGGNASDYAIIRHLLPWNEWYQRCQRCGKTWNPPNTLNYEMETPEGKAAFEAASREYKEAMSWPTDNIPSTGITFQHHSDDNDASARQFVNEVTKNTTLR
jgi:hypothetical protein